MATLSHWRRALLVQGGGGGGGGFGGWARECNASSSHSLPREARTRESSAMRCSTLQHAGLALTHIDRVARLPRCAEQIWHRRAPALHGIWQHH